MCNSENSGAGQFSQAEMGEIWEMFQSMKSAQQEMNSILAGLGKALGWQVTTIRIIDAKAPGFVKIHEEDIDTELSVSETSIVVFLNQSNHKATLKLPIGPSGMMVEISLKPGESLNFDFRMWISNFTTFLSYTGNPRWKFELSYSVQPSGNGGGPNIIFRP